MLKKNKLIRGLSFAVTAALGTASLHAEGLPEPRTPDFFKDVFNGFVIGTFKDGKLATKDQFFSALKPNDPFYKEPKLNGTEKPGTILKSMPVQLQYTGFRPGNVRAFKLMYVTTALNGAQDISTGILMIPQDGKDDAKRPLIEYQEANDSVGPYCHPSSQWTGADPLDGASMSALGPLAIMFGRGAAVMISDVGNNGDMKPHGIFAGKYGAMTALDGARAALSLRPAGLNKKAPINLFGIAGGGVGAGFAGEMAPTYAPELNIKSTVLEGMVINQKSFLKKTNGSVGSGFGFATLVGLDPQYPNMKLDKYLNKAGLEKANYYRTQCQLPAYFDMPFVSLNSLFKGNQDPADIPAFQPVFADNLLGRRAPKSKVLITSCVADDSPMSLVPAKDSKDLAEKYRRKGAHVDYRPTNCSMLNAMTNIYGWGTDLFGMQTLDWVFATLNQK